MTDYDCFGHTQTLSHKVVGLCHANFIAGFARRALRYDPTTSVNGGGRRDQERISALQSSSIRRERKDRRLHTAEAQQVVTYA